MLPRRFLRACSTVLVGIALAGHAAAAPPSDKTATQLKAEGDAAFDAFLYSDALRAYEAAYEASHDPALLFNRGRALQSLGRYPEALEMFERFDKEAPPALRAKVPGLPKLIEEVRGRVATLKVVCNVGDAQVVASDRVLGEASTLGEVRVNAGSTILKVTREGYFPVKREVVLKAATTTTVEVKLLPRATSGVLAIVVEPKAARVTIDGKFEGSAPIELVLPAGTHEVSLSSPGYEPLTSKAVVKADGRSDVRLTMNATPSVLSRWWFWTGVGAVVVTGVVVGIVLTTNRSPGEGDFSPGRATAPLITF
jgi:hypothetical protein